MSELRLAAAVVAIILAILAAIPPVPHSGSLLALSLAFGWVAHLP